MRRLVVIASAWGLSVVALGAAADAGHTPSLSVAPLAPTLHIPPPPPTPTISATRRGRTMFISYRFRSWPVGDRRPRVLLTSVKSVESRYLPYTVQTAISRRSGVVTQPTGLGRGPFTVLASAYSRTGRRSRVVRTVVG